MSDAKQIMDMIRENDISYDLRFTDPRGKMQHVTQHIDTIDEETLSRGLCLTDRQLLAGKQSMDPT